MKRPQKKFLILALVFFTGACSLIVEVVALRVLSPHFGNTIFTASSVIGTVLSALSLGYYIGGRLADRRGHRSWISGLVLAAGLSVLSIEFFANLVLPAIAPDFSMAMGPLAMSLALFFLPSLCLGALSPFAVAILHDDAAEGVARLTGAVFFWSTFGSIVGSLLSGFVLIPNFGIDSILLGVGLSLSALGTLPWLAKGSNISRLYGFSVLIAFGWAAFASWQQSPVSAGTIYGQPGVYESISVRDGQEGGRPVRYFFQDKSCSGAMFLDAQNVSSTEDDMVFDYTKYFSAYRPFKPEAKRALVIGGGAFTVPKALLMEPSVSEVRVAEIEPSLSDLAKRYFRLPEDPRLVVSVEDGRRLLARAGQPFDIIFSDVYYSLYSVPAHFTTVEFFEMAKSRLSEDGVFIANFIGDLSRQEPSLLLSEIRTFQRVFPNAVAIGVHGQRTREVQNVMLIGVNSSEGPSEVADGLGDLAGRLGGEAVDMSRFELTPYPVLTDDFAPVDFMMASAIGRMDREGSADQPDGQEMLAMIRQQLRYGSRAIGAPGHDKARGLIISEAKALGLQVLLQDWKQASASGTVYQLSNIVARYRPEAMRRFLVATHYDTRALAVDGDTTPHEPVPGANDGASGVAAVLETARLLTGSRLAGDMGLDFVFFDGEEGMPDGQDWHPLGSEFFVRRLPDLYGANPPVGALVMDMVCANDSVFHPEITSLRDAPQATEAFWSSATKRFPDAFSWQGGESILDDHTPLNVAGIPAFLVIGWDYPFFHTTHDVADKCSSQKLETVVRAVADYVQTMD